MPMAALYSLFFKGIPDRSVVFLNGPPHFLSFPDAAGLLKRVFYPGPDKTVAVKLAEKSLVAARENSG